jgi:hypothetical protein
MRRHDNDMNSQHVVQTFPTSGFWTSVGSFDNEGNSSWIVVVTGAIKLAQVAVALDIDEGQRRAVMLARQTVLHMDAMLLQDVHQDVPALIVGGEGGAYVELRDVYS